MISSKHFCWATSQMTTLPCPYAKEEDLKKIAGSSSYKEDITRFTLTCPSTVAEDKNNF